MMISHAAILYHAHMFILLFFIYIYVYNVAFCKNVQINYYYYCYILERSYFLEYMIHNLCKCKLNSQTYVIIISKISVSVEASFLLNTFKDLPNRLIECTSDTTIADEVK